MQLLRQSEKMDLGMEVLGCVLWIALRELSALHCVARVLLTAKRSVRIERRILKSLIFKWWNREVWLREEYEKK
jgi:hypothetical protein